jgi:hypothetical protein
LAERARQFAVNPDLGIIVQRRLKNYGRSSRIEITDAIGNRQLDAIPIETQPSITTPLIQTCRANNFPLRIVKIRATSVWCVVVCFD